METKVAERKCPRCGVTRKAHLMETLQRAGYSLACLDKACPKFETWPEVKDGVV